jgi:hypothetical protein
VIDAILNRLDVAVEHGCIRLQTGGVNLSGQIQPTLSITLMRANH